MRYCITHKRKKSNLNYEQQTAFARKNCKEHFRRKKYISICKVSHMRWAAARHLLVKCSFILFEREKKKTLILSSEVQTKPINFSLSAFVSLTLSLSMAPIRTYAYILLRFNLFFSSVQFSISFSHTFHKNYRIQYSQKFHNESSKFQT